MKCLTSTYIRRIACQDVAKAKILARLVSTFFASVPTSATLIENNGFLASIATVSAVVVLPTPGGPKPMLAYRYTGCAQHKVEP